MKSRKTESNLLSYGFEIMGIMLHGCCKKVSGHQVIGVVDSNQRIPSSIPHCVAIS